MRKIIVGVFAVIIIGIICLAALKPGPSVDDADLIYKPFAKTGDIAEKVIGDQDSAELIIYEYADFGCSHCADWNRTINDLMKKYDGKIALVFRNYNIGLKNNGAVAARAATAAYIQGYFKEYKDLLFANQAEWIYEDEAKLSELLSDYFKKASNGAGDVDKFMTDIWSDAVKTRLEFEQNLGKRIGVVGTPTFRVNGETVQLNELIERIETIYQ